MASVQGVLSKAVKSIEGRAPKIKGVFSSVGKYTKISAQKFDNAAKSLGESAKAMFEGGQKLKLKSANNAAKNATKTISDISAKASTTAKIEQIGTELPEGIPKHLYHMTSEANYKSVLKDGVMRASKFEAEGGGLPGVYMISKKNFLEQWCGRPQSLDVDGEIWKIADDIGERLIQYTSAGGSTVLDGLPEYSKMVAMKIPTASLDPSKIRFRPTITASNESAYAFAKELQVPKICSEGLPLSELSKYIDKEPVEYIYKDNIPAKLFSEAIKSDVSIDMPYQKIVKNLFG